MFRSPISERLSRRLALAAGLYLASQAALAQPTAPAQVELVMWSAGDCVFCELWRKGERQQEFNAEARRVGARLLLVAKPHLNSPDHEYLWPAGALVPPELQAKLEWPKVLPTFDLLCKGQRVRRLIGLADWDSYWEKALADAARRCGPAATAPAPG